jgi:hypothetical protein
MTNWITLQLSDLNNYLASAQVHALDTASLATGQTGRFAALMTDVVARMRVAIQSQTRNQISATALTLPPELKWVGCYLVIEAMQAALPGLKLSDEQRDQIKRAENQLRRVADGLEAVTTPLDPMVPGGVQRGGQVQWVERSTRLARRVDTNEF